MFLIKNAILRAEVGRRMPLTMRWFSVNGLSIYSEVPLPAKLRAVPIDNRADVVIVTDPFLKNGMDPGKFYSQWGPSIATVCVPGSGVLRMIRGEKMIVSPFAGADEERLQQIILYDGISAILTQRGHATSDHAIPVKEVMTGSGRPH